ncbi:hypothetical protein M514_19105 [Trichuris suis]|uniref:Uncharacterized protein n=1 Tax=Trichuris suis TaxID=68888 RepID=A0A085NGR6_9BILA|nr:hypothetical protein M514_19105 [Trichuris suis]
MKVSGEIACTGIENAVAFKDELDQIIAKEKYLPEQIFNVYETSWFWKCIPERTYTQHQFKTVPGHKVNKDCVTLLLGGNVARFKL